MFKLHIISDLDYDFNEFSDEIDETIPDVDLVVINGNISRHLKRSMLYAETLAKRYPSVHFIFNQGEKEKYMNFFPKFNNEGEENSKLRQWANDSWPKNLYSQKNIRLNLKSGDAVDVLCMYGFPFIHSYTGEWEDTHWCRNYVSEVTEDQNKFIPPGVSHVYCGQGPVWATKDWINEKHIEEFQTVKSWELDKSSYKILVTQINPYKDIRTQGQKVSSYNVHLHNKLWITTGILDAPVNYLGAKLVSNHGRGFEPRSKVITINP